MIYDVLRTPSYFHTVSIKGQSSAVSSRTDETEPFSRTIWESREYQRGQR